MDNSFSRNEMSRMIQETRDDVREIKGHVVELKESKAATRAKVDGHATQIALLWTITILSIGAVVAAYFSK